MVHLRWREGPKGLAPQGLNQVLTETLRLLPAGLEVSFRGRRLRGEEVVLPPGVVGYVTVMEEKGEVPVGKDFSEGSSNEDEREEQELAEPPEALERDFVSTGGQGRSGGWGGSGDPDVELSPFLRTSLSELLPVSAASHCGAWRPFLVRMPKCAGR